MRRSDAISIFGSVPALAEAIGVTRGRIYQLPEELPQDMADRIVGAAMRLGHTLPAKLRHRAAANRKSLRKQARAELP